MDDYLKLIKVTYTRGNVKQPIATETSREVLAHESEVTRSEFFGASQTGFSPSLTIQTNRINYEAETIAEWHGVRYAIYRTYRIPGSDTIELYLERRAGISGRED